MQSVDTKAMRTMKKLMKIMKRYAKTKMSEQNETRVENKASEERIQKLEKSYTKWHIQLSECNGERNEEDD